MPRARVNGVELHYEATGEGPAVVFLHGLMGSIARERSFGGGMERLVGHGFRLIVYDARGHGESGYTEDLADYTWQAHARDMLALLDHLGLERAAVGGGSMGAGVSLTLALAHPERVERLVLVAPPPLRADLGLARQVFGGFASMIESLGLEQAVEVSMQLPQFGEMRERQPDEFERTREWLLSLKPRPTVLAIRGLLDGPPLAEERFTEIAAPTLVLAHPDDPIHPISSARRIHEAVPGSRLVAAPEMAYWQQHGDELLDAVAQFLRGDAAK